MTVAILIAAYPYLVGLSAMVVLFLVLSGPSLATRSKARTDKSDSSTTTYTKTERLRERLLTLFIWRRIKTSEHRSGNGKSAIEH